MTAGIGVDNGHGTPISSPVGSHTNSTLRKNTLKLPLLLEPQSSDSSTISPSTPSSLRNSESTTSSTHLLLPIPNPGNNKSQASFVLSDDENHSVMLDPLPEDIRNADISIAHDGSFVETSSGPAARELKKRYDQHLGVRDPTRSEYKISPYAITAFVNQHGKQMYRVGHRELSPPALSASKDFERQISHQKSASHSNNQIPVSALPSKRRSRMSVHAFLPFKNGGNIPPQVPSVVDDVSRSPIRKLRKARSLTNMFGAANSAAPSQMVQGFSTVMPGRPHAHSVTGVDFVRGAVDHVNSYSPPRKDIFSDVMQWEPISPMHSPSSTTTDSDEQSYQRHIIHPFGHGVSFDSPSNRSVDGQFVTPHSLREMQSFDSGLTARADSEAEQKDNATLRIQKESGDPSEDVILSLPLPVPIRTTVEIRASPSLETSMHSRYSTGVFDVLQNYRGLPLLEKLSPTSTETTVIRMSTSTESSATPKDDPRFVIWGEIHPEDDDDSLSISNGSHTDISSHSGPSHKSMKGKNSTSSPSEPSKVRIFGDRSHKVLIAATIERWIAQLTSELNYDELLIFFLTYRTYVSAVDLCHLLICRFHWAVELPCSTKDDTIKKIVRARTFIAIRYWLLKFFAVDFVPNRELRVLFADWLNTLSRDPILETEKGVLDIVRKLKKVAKECRDAHTTKSRICTTATRSSIAQSRRSDLSQGNDSDIDLDFLPVKGSEFSGPQNFVVSSQSSSSSILSADTAILQQPLHLAILQQIKQPHDVKPSGPFVPTPTTLPFHHGPLSRAFVNTIGKLGRWKRVLNSRHHAHLHHPTAVEVSPFDLEPNATGDLLSVRGGVEQYLKMIEVQSLQSPSTHITTPSADGSSRSLPSTPSKETDLPLPHNELPDITDHKPSVPLNAVSEEPEEESDSQSECRDRDDISSLDRSISPQSYDSDLSRRQTFESDLRSRHPGKPSWQMDIVSIDRLELSDMSSNEDEEEPAAPPGLRREIRKLPLRKNFEFVRRSVDSMSSFGFRKRDSVASAASGSATSSASAEPEIGGPLQQWQVNALVDSLSDDEEAGDVEAALRNLEGRISHVKQMVKQSKVDNWINSIRDRLINGDYGDEQPRFPTDDQDSENQTSEGTGQEFGELGKDSDSDRLLSASSINYTKDAPGSSPPSEVNTPVVNEQSTGTRSGPASPIVETEPRIDDAVPLEILRSRVSPRPSTAGGSISSSAGPGFNSLTKHPSSVFIGPQPVPKLQRSIFLGHRAAVLADQFAVIERDLFLGLNFEEFVIDDWTRSVEESNILDWNLFLSDTARYKGERRGGPKTTALVAFRGRFNLCANFIVSEVILTHPHERPFIVGKWIRVAWRLYERGCFNTLVAIIAGLKSDWVTKVMRKSWHRIGMWENRMFHDLVAVTSPVGDFKFLRHEVEAAIKARPLNSGLPDESVTSSDGQSSAPNRKANNDNRVQPRPACIPFLGIYLAQLYRHSQLPDLIDPTCPTEPVSVDSETNIFEAPAYPEVFSTLAPLPPSMQLEPLINIHKQRLIARMIQSFVVGQHLASMTRFPIDKKLYERCWKLKALDEDTLHRVWAIYPD